MECAVLAEKPSRKYFQEWCDAERALVPDLPPSLRLTRLHGRYETRVNRGTFGDGLASAYQTIVKLTICATG